MFRQQHQCTADEIFGARGVRRPGFRDLFVQRRGRRRHVENRCRGQAHDACAQRRPPIARTVMGAWIGIGRERQHRTGASQRCFIARGGEHGAHGGRQHR